MNCNKLLSIVKPAEIIGVRRIDETLREWDKEGKLKPFLIYGKHYHYKIYGNRSAEKLAALEHKAVVPVQQEVEV